MRKIFLVILSLLALLVPISAQEADDSVFVRAAHFSTDALEVDVYINGELTLEAFAFPNISDWLELSAGTYTIDVVATGAAIEDALVSGEYDLSAGDWATVIVRGEVNRDTLAIQAVVDDLSAIPEGLTFVSAFHAITDLDPVNVFVGETELVRLLSYPEVLVDTDGYASDTVLAGDYDFDIQDADGNSLLSVDTTTLGAGRAYFIAAVGTAANPLYVFVVTDVEALTGDVIDPLADIETGDGTAFARIGHFSVSAGDVDVYLNGSLTLEAVQFGSVSDYLEVDAGFYDVALVATGDTLENAVYEGQIAIVTDSVTLVSAVGLVGDESLTVVTSNENNVAPEFGLSRIAFFQAIPSLELFNLSANGDSLIQGVVYPNIFVGALDGYVSVDVVTGDYTLVVDGAGNTLNVGNVTTGAGRIYLVVSSGTETEPVSFLIPSDFPSGE
jgi:hypothetical protein